MYFSSPTYQIDGVNAGTSSIDCRRSHIQVMDDISQLGDESSPPCSTSGTTASPTAAPPPTGCTTVSGADPGKSCVFPFRFNGVVYNECTFDGNAAGETEPWCSTLTDSNNDHVGGQGNWGFCSSNCGVVTSTTSAPATTGQPSNGHCGEFPTAQIVLNIEKIINTIGQKLIFLITLFKVCGRNSVTPTSEIGLDDNDPELIVGGVNAAKGEAGWQVALVSSQSSSRPYCGGTLIQAQWVMTAAHCTDGYASWQGC